VRNNTGARTGRGGRETAYYIERERGLEDFLGQLRADLKALKILATKHRSTVTAMARSHKATITTADGPGSACRRS
jgi:hypothetical protein